MIEVSPDAEQLQLLLLGYTDEQRAALEKEYEAASNEVRTVLLRALGVAAERICDLLTDATGDRKRKRARPVSGSETAASEVVDESNLEAICTIRDISTIIPSRRKHHLIIYSTALHLTAPAPDGQLGEVVYRLPLDQLQRVVCLPTPDKVKSTWTFAFMGQASSQQLAFQLQDTADVEIAVVNPAYFADIAEADNMTSRQLLVWLFSKACSQTVEEPSGDYLSSRSESFVRCYLKNREGHLYPLKDGILFGLKKPMVFLRYSDLNALESQASGSKNYDLVATDIDDHHHTFSMIDTKEIGLFHYVITGWKSGKRKAGRSSTKGDSSATTDGKQPKDESSDESSSEEDSDFIPDDSANDVPEEFEEDYDSSSSEEEEDNDQEDGEGEEEAGQGEGEEESGQGEEEDSTAVDMSGEE